MSSISTDKSCIKKKSLRNGAKWYVMDPAMISEFHMKIQNPEYSYKNTFCARVRARAYMHTQTQTEQRPFR